MDGVPEKVLLHTRPYLTHWPQIDLPRIDLYEKLAFNLSQYLPQIYSHGVKRPQWVKTKIVDLAFVL